MTSDFTPAVAKSPPPKNAQNSKPAQNSVRVYSLALLRNAACFTFILISYDNVEYRTKDYCRSSTECLFLCMFARIS